MFRSWQDNGRPTLAEDTRTTSARRGWGKCSCSPRANHAPAKWNPPPLKSRVHQGADALPRQVSQPVIRGGDRWDTGRPTEYHPGGRAARSLMPRDLPAASNVDALSVRAPGPRIPGLESHPSPVVRNTQLTPNGHQTDLGAVISDRPLGHGVPHLIARGVGGVRPSTIRTPQNC